MFRKLGIGATAAAVAFSAVAAVGTVNAQAYTTQFTTSVTYMNVGTATANVALTFYKQENGTAINVPGNPLPANAGTSVFVGSLSNTDIAQGFTGSAVMSADQPIVATMVQVPQGSTTVKNRPLSNGFSSGASKYLIATVLKNKFNSSTKFSVQNADSEAVNVSVSFGNADNPAAAPIVIPVNNLAPGAAKYFDAGQLAQLGASFNGSATITAVKSANPTEAGSIVASALELSTNGPGASSFEGVKEGGKTFYMPSAICDKFGQRTAFAVQNIGASGSGDAAVTVTYSNGRTQTKSIAPGTKKSFLGCGDEGFTNPAGFIGSAVLTSTGNDIVAIGKVIGGGGFTTAFEGAARGASKVALPYVRWTDTRYDTNPNARQRTYIAIQNVSGADIAAGAVTVDYFDKDGNKVGTHTLGAIAKDQKVNSTAKDIGATEFGYSGTTFGGSAVVNGPANSVVVVARVQSKDVGTAQVAEDYNGVVLTQ